MFIIWDIHTYLVILVGGDSYKGALRKVLSVDNSRSFLPSKLVDNNSWGVLMHGIEGHLEKKVFLR